MAVLHRPHHHMTAHLGSWRALGGRSSPDSVETNARPRIAPRTLASCGSRRTAASMTSSRSAGGSLPSCGNRCCLRCSNIGKSYNEWCS